MKLLLKVYPIFILFLILSCSNIRRQISSNEVSLNTIDSAQSTEHNNRMNEINTSDNIYFKSSGTEPFWGLTISDKGIVITTITDSIIVPHTTPVQAMDSNVKMYKTETDSAQLTIQISQLQCSNAMSGELSPYAVSVTYKDKTKLSAQKLEGCGAYITDYRLHDIWVLESLNGQSIDRADYINGLPIIEIYSATNSFIGFGGCNQIAGQLFFEKGLLRFKEVTTTEKLCTDSNLEKLFIEALQSTTTYKIENNRLRFSNPSKQLLVLKKID
ncbi:META domain-containing protein [Flavobacterium algicola]|uniref:META domain-containing protein n=1 Tax=Flavobacterium algicola TaxID=556529 RepID=UPI001EFDB059|nr:META domain-containing protein [Flavobacterium algicola]MCG9792626.1 META domain-containing protein [Flavobacterium algicola]